MYNVGGRPAQIIGNRCSDTKYFGLLICLRSSFNVPKSPFWTGTGEVYIVVWHVDQSELLSGKLWACISSLEDEYISKWPELPYQMVMLW